MSGPPQNKDTDKQKSCEVLQVGLLMLSDCFNLKTENDDLRPIGSEIEKEKKKKKYPEMINEAK